MRVLGVTGYAQHGKNTVAEVLADLTPVVQVGFADALRTLASHVNPIVGGHGQRYQETVQQNGYEEAKRNPEVRRYLQDLGTGVRDVIGPDSWVKALEHSLEQYQDLDVTVVVTDVRFPNEAAWVKEHGALWGVVRLADPGYVSGMAYLDEASAWDLYDSGVDRSHPSEASIPCLLQASSFLLVAHSREELAEQVHQAWGWTRMGMAHYNHDWSVIG